MEWRAERQGLDERQGLEELLGGWLLTYILAPYCKLHLSFSNVAKRCVPSVACQVLPCFGPLPAPALQYVLSNIEKKGLRRGDRVWQIAFGSGFKCNSAVWRALRPIREVHPAWDDDM